MTDFASETMKDPRGYLTVEQVNKLMGVAPNLRDRLILQLLYRCGRRVSEVLLIKKEDILWEDRKIIFSILKRKKPLRELKPVDGETMKLLDLYVNGNIALRGLRKKMDGNMLFPVTRQYVFKMIRKLGEQAGITHVGNKKLHPHHLRHSFCVHQVRSNVKDMEGLRQLQRYMGHANLTTTSHYMQFNSEDLRGIVDGMWGKREKK